MPGLNQLKNFVNNLQSLGNEASVRAARGETLRTLPFPENASEADDSEDLLYGLPVKEDETEAASTDTSADASSDAPAESASVPTTSDGEIDIDALLNSNIDGSVDTQNAPAASEPAPQETVPEQNAPAETSAEAPAPDLPDFGDLPDVNEEPVVESFDAAASTDAPASSSTDDFEMPSFDGIDDAAGITASSTDDTAASTDFELPDFDGIETDSAAADTGTSDSDFDLPDFGDMPSQDITSDSGVSAQADASSAADDFEMPDFGSDFSVDETPAAPAESSEPAAEPKASSLPDFSLDSDSLDLPDFDLDDQDNSAKVADETPGVNMNLDSAAPSADFDMPDFGGSDADSSPAADAVSESPADETAKDDFSIEGFADDAEEAADEFSIPGFSDVTEIVEPKKKKSVSADNAEEKVESNQFTNAEYQKFIENLNYYPLNLRIEIENILIEDQFNEEENLKLVRMVIKKTPVRQLANHVGKMVDKVIEVPRNYEKRTAAQYEAYKQSTEYQLKNRIIPFIAACLAIAILAGSTFFLGKTFVYEPVRAEILYKEGYTLLEGEYYPLSEEKFIAAANYKKKKAW
ncbi:MAG: hypothetical protein J6W46_04545, partial [Spirochaetaceae bacterium]|nr:hypothetical protein [Spirochaetaceae bacterium]